MAAKQGHLISWFRDIGSGDRLTVGGKGAGLGELIRAGIAVPPGFVATTTAFERFLAAIDGEGSIRATIEALDPGNLDELVEVSGKLRERIEGSAVSREIQDAVVSAYSELCGEDREAPVAVRSSATSEDSEEASFAGLQETYLWVCGPEKVLAAVRQCWSSLYSTESVSYRRRLGLPEDQLAMGVVVQRMVHPKCSGVMFTRSPTSGDRSVIIIEASWGLGSSIVSGDVTPDNFVVSKVTNEVTRRSVSEKSVQHVPDLEAGGVSEEPVPLELRSVSCLEDDEIQALVQIARRAEDHFGCPQDIEWAISREDTAGQGIYLLQSRPETVWARREEKSIVQPKERAMDHVFSLLGGGKR
ncbi:MAG: PEP/pyruvate-binding domain-containing protein [Sphingomonadales bacterium]